MSLEKSLELVEGRPENMSERLEKEQRVYQLLDDLGLTYWRVDHEVTMTMEACREIDKLLDATICKNLFLCNKQQTAFYLLMIPGEKSLRTSELSHKLGTTRLSFAPAEKMEELMDLTPGSVTVLGLMNDPEKRVQLVIDQEVKKGQFFGCHPCINTSSLKLYTADLLERILPALDHEPIFVELAGQNK